MDDHSLFELEKDYYLGNYQSCINKANSTPACRESIFYMCLSYFHLKKFDILEHEITKSSEPCVKLIGMLVACKRDPEEKDAIINQLSCMLEDKTVDAKDDLSRLVASSIFSHEKMYSDALKALDQLNSLPALLATISILILMNRLDLAEKRLATMQSKDDFATLTLLALAQVRLATGNAKESHDIAKELEDKYRATPLLKNIQTAAAISMGNIDLAKQHCENSLDLDNDNLEAMINMIHILTKSRASNEIKERNFGRLKALYPTDEFVKDFERLDLELAQ